ncbi:MAG: hypothetical protein AAF572_12160 [Cyanobacteria bacterium P01_B01_bin.77]
MSQASTSGTVYVQNYISGKSGTLYSLDLATGKATSIGSLATEVYDLAFVEQNLYGLRKKDFGFRKTMKLIKIDPASGKSEDVGDTQFDVVGLACNPTNNKLYATAHRNSQIVELNLKTGRGTPVVTLSDRERQCGEIAFSAEGIAYITLIGTDLKKYLATCNLTTGEVILLGDTTFPGLASMKFIGNDLYGVAGKYEGLGGSNGQLIRIDKATGQGQLVTTTDPLACWAGIAIGAPVPVQPPSIAVKPIGITPQSPVQPPTKSKEEAMSLLTIDTKDNCYVIDPSEMNNLQQNVANSLTLEEGIFDIKIASGRYSYSRTEAEGEPFVLLWIYGVDGNTFVNRNTGAEIGTTWTTLNGYNDVLQIETKGKTVICALFFDTNSQDNGGAVKVLVSSKKSTFTPKTLTVDSQKNCYVLNESHLKSLQQWGSNFIELTPGNYRFKIRESNASYWSDNKKFDLEPWALLWIKVGKFIPKLTGIEISETWCSLNGLKDELILEVKEKTTVSGYFFDTFKDDNEGQIILEIESVENIGDLPQGETVDPIISVDYAADSGGNPVITGGGGGSVTTGGGGSVTTGGGGSVTTGGGARTSGGSYVSSGSGGSWEEISFTFNFDDSQVEQAWEKIAAKVEAAVTVSDEQDATVEARRWDQLENWLMTGYKAQAKDLAMQVARLELMMNTFKQQFESNLQLNFRRWSTHFDGRLQSLVGTQIEEVTQRNLTVAIEQLKLEILNQMSRLVQTEINSAKAEINQSVETQVSSVRSDLTSAIESQVTSLRSELTKSIETNISSVKAEFNKSIETNISTVKSELTKAIETSISTVKTEINRDIDTKITNVTTEINKNISVTNVVSEEVSASIKTDINKDIDNRFADIRTNIIDNLEKKISTDVDTRLIGVRTDISSLEKNVDNKLEAIRIDFRGEVVSAILEQITNLIEEKTKLEIAKVDFNTYLAQIDARATKYLQQLSQLEVNLIARINEGDTHLYNWVLSQLMQIKGCITDRQVMVDQLEAFSNQLKTRLDTAPCISPTNFESWTPLPIEPKTLAGGGSAPQLPSNG